ncbi:MAG: glycoside hydrolase family 11 protein [Fibrobacter sp.]|nr:glycoside hydrolase family 11 protein [Fibrobacter sp.]
MEKRISKIVKAGIVLAFGLGVTNVMAVDACKDEMGHSGSGHSVNGNQTGSIQGTSWGFEQWSAGGSNSMKYYDNGTFEASWNNNQDYLARVGFRYGDNGSGVDHTTKHYTVDYKYTKTGTAQYGYIGVYGWTVNPQVEYYIVDDWFSRPSEAYIGAKRGEITVDGDTYTIHAYLRQQEASKTGTSTFLQIFSVRQNARQCGHIDISAHFKKWDELFTGQQAQLSGSKGGGSATLKFGRPTEVMLMTEAGGGATGSVDYTYFNMSENGEASEVSSTPTTGTTDTGNTGTDTGYTGTDWGNMGGDGNTDWGNMFGGGGNTDWSSMFGGDGNTDWSSMFGGDGNTDWSSMFGGDGNTDWGNMDWGNMDWGNMGGETGNQGNASIGGNDDGKTAIQGSMKLNNASRTFRVFDLKGHFLGEIELARGVSASEALMTRFHKAGVYMIKSGSFTQRVSVK